MSTPNYEDGGAGWQPQAIEPVNPDLPLIPSGRRAARVAGHEEAATGSQPGYAAPAYAAPQASDYDQQALAGLLAQVQGARAAAPAPDLEPEPEAVVLLPAAAQQVPSRPEPSLVAESLDTVVEWLARRPQEAAAPGAEAQASVISMAPAPAPAPADAEDDLVTHALTEAERTALQHADRELLACLHEVVAQNASDLHVTASAAPMIRVDGGLRPALGDTPWSRERVARALHSLLTDDQRRTFEEKLELDFAYTISANARFRVNFYQQRGAMGAAFRLIPTEIKTLDQLGVPPIIGEFSKLPRGLVLVTGPTGSGKSTTLAALIDLANSTRNDHIVTVEDPIEFLHRHKSCLVNQREVGSDTHSFANALKHVLRQDPDIILIGELRDLETIQVALTSAETGHLVFATLHTQDAPQTIDRVIDVFPPHQQGQVRAQLAATLRGVVCQTLVKRASGRGRVVATEIMMTTPAIANLIREGKTYQIASMMQAGGDSGMHTLDQHLADLVSAGTVTLEAAEEKVQDPDGFDRLLERKGMPTAAPARAMAGPDFGDSFSNHQMGR